jgi:hypothetical protein
MTGLTHRSDTWAVPRLRRALTSSRLRARATLTQALAPVAAVGVLILLVQGHGLAWLAGLAAGASATAWLLMVRMPRTATAPATVHRGAEDTRDQLGLLEHHGWQAVHAIEGRLGVYEHVAVGPGGVVLLHSRCPAHASVAAPTLAADPGASNELTRLRRQALGAAANLRDEILDATGQPTWVQAVIVVWSEFPAGCVQDGRCVFISGPRLVDWLRRRPGQLSSARVDEILTVLPDLGVSLAA